MSDTHDGGIEIVSHPLCPHAQRLVLLGLVADRAPGEDFVVTYLPYPELRALAPRYSETGELPALRLDGETVSTASIDAAEYLAALWRPDLNEAAPGARLERRSALRSADRALDRLRGVFTARDRAALDDALTQFFAALAPVERGLPVGDDGAALDSHVAIALAPLASLTRPFEAFRADPRWGGLPKLTALIAAAARDERVRRAEPADYAAEFGAFFAMTGSAFPALMASAGG